MLAIRMQRTGRSGHAQFRVVVQDSHFNPKSGRVVAYLGSYNPHTKAAIINGEKLSQYLENGAQPSERVARLLQKEGVKLPGWVKLSQDKKRSVRHAEKRRSTAPKEEANSTEQATDAAEGTKADVQETPAVAEADQQPDQNPEKEKPKEA
jgi:small subunit ribosomal protein S16